MLILKCITINVIGGVNIFGVKTMNNFNIRPLSDPHEQVILYPSETILWYAGI